MTLDVTVEHNEVRPLVVVDDSTAFGEVAHHLLAIALVMDEEAEQVAGGAAVANMEGETVFGAGKAAWLKDLRDQIGPDMGDESAQAPHGRGGHVDVGEEHA